MNDRLKRDFEEFVDHGGARGAQATYDAATSGPAYVVQDVGAHSRSGAWRFAMAIPAAAVLILLCLAVASGRGNSGLQDESATGSVGSESDSPSSASTVPVSPTVDPLIAEQMKNGWAPLSSATIPLGDGTVVPANAWVPFDLDPTKVMDEKGRLPVYDKPDGQVIGFLFDVGYAPAAVANSSDFDIDAVRESMGVCPQGDNPCTRAKIEEMSKPDVGG